MSTQHYVRPDGRIACSSLDPEVYPSTTDPSLVSCAGCRKTLAWQGAHAKTLRPSQKTLLRRLHPMVFDVRGRELRGSEVVAFYHAIPDVPEMLRAIKALSRGDEKWHRALQVLRTRDLIRYDPGKMQWARTAP